MSSKDLYVKVRVGVTDFIVLEEIQDTNLNFAQVNKV